MSGSFLRSGGMRARELLFRSRVPLASGCARETAQRPRAYVRSFPAAQKVIRDSSSHISHAASSALSSAVSRNGFVSWYIGMIEARPILTKSLTSGAIFIAADISSQIVTHSALDSFDWIRTLRMASYGMLVAGPSLHLWFNFASRIIPKRDVISTLKKMLIGQACYGPFMTSIFFSLNAVLQGESATEVLARLKRDLIPTLMNGLVYWPMCDFVTFRFIPVRLQGEEDGSEHSLSPLLSPLPPRFSVLEALFNRNLVLSGFPRSPGLKRFLPLLSLRMCASPSNISLFWMRRKH